MKKFILILSILFVLLSCKKTSTTNNDGIVEIREKMFIGQVNDVYINEKDYLGKTIKLEGLFMNEQGYDESDSEYYSLYAVYRYGPGGCCGYDGIVGFEVRWPEGKEDYYPENDSWVEATGIINKYDYNNIQVVYLDLISLNVLNKRGKEYVTQ